MGNRIERKSGMRGRYKFVVGRTTPKGVELVSCESDWVNNLITDLGLDLIATDNSYMRVCAVGTGNAAPSVSDLQLDSFLVSTTNVTGRQQGVNSTEPYAVWARKTFRFNQGQAAGNISEVGIGSGVSQLFSRALVLDGGGNPTSITVLPDEWLEVIYELTLEIDTTDVTGQVTLGGNIGGTYDFIFRPCLVTTLKPATNITAGRGWGFFSSTAPEDNTMSDRLINWGSDSDGGSFTSDIGPVTGQPSGTPIGGSSSGNRPSTLVLPYVPGSHEIIVRRTAGLSQNNGNIRSMGFSVGIMHHQIQFDPPIPKTSNDVLVLDIAHRWGRA